MKMLLTYKKLCLFVVLLLSSANAMAAAAAAISATRNFNSQFNEREYSGKGYTEDIEDMRVKVQGGYIRIVRTITDNQWIINRRWNPITFSVVQPSLPAELIDRSNIANQEASSNSGGSAVYVPPSTFTRNGITYDGSFNSNSRMGMKGLPEWNADKRELILRFRWSDLRTGDWIDYEKKYIVAEGKKLVTEGSFAANTLAGTAFPVSFGRRNQAAHAKLVYDSLMRLTKVVDQNDSLVYTFTYAEDECYDSLRNIKPCTNVTKITDYTGRSIEYYYGPAQTAEDRALLPSGCDHCVVFRFKDVRGFFYRYYLTAVSAPVSTGGGAGSSGGGGTGSGTATGSAPAPKPSVLSRYHLMRANGLFSSPGVPVAVSGRSISATYTWHDPKGQITVIKEKNKHVASKLRYSNAEDETGVGVYYKFEYDKEKDEFYTQEKYTSGRVVEKWVDGKEGEAIRTDINSETVLQQNSRKGADGRLIRQKKSYNGLTTTDELDYRYLLLKRTHPDESSEEWDYEFSQRLEDYLSYSLLKSYKDENGVVTEYKYDDNGNLIKKAEAKGTSAERITEYTYDSYGNMISEKKVGDATTGTVTTTWEYDSKGNVAKMTDPEGYVFRYENYDALGNAGKEIDSRGKEWLFLYDPAGNLIKESTPLGFESFYEYDQLGNLIKIQDPEGAVLLMSYDERNNLIIEEWKQSGESYNKKYEYDDEDRLLVVVDESGYRNIVEYDEVGRPVHQKDAENNSTNFHYDNANGSINAGIQNVKKITLPSYQEHFSYDKRGRMSRKTLVGNDGGQSWTWYWQYDNVGNVTHETNPLGHKSNYQYNQLRQMTRYRDSLQREVSYVSTSRDRYKQVIDQRGNSTYFEYDKRDRVKIERNSLGFEYRYVYGEGGFLTESITPKGNVTVYSYDDDGRLISEVTFKDSKKIPSESLREVTYRYNKRSQVIYWGNRHMSSSVQYDHWGRVISQSFDYGSVSKSISYTYYVNDTIKTYTDFEGTTYTYLYDKADKLKSIKIPGLGAIVINDYEWGVPAKVTLPGGSVYEMGYSAFQSMESLKVKDTAGNELKSIKYTRNGIGKVTNISDAKLGNRNVLYSDDGKINTVERVVSGQMETELAFTFDEASNVSLKGEQWEYNSFNQLVKRPGFVYEYDKNGNRVSVLNGSKKYFYNYDSRDRLVSILDENNNILSEYAYNPMDQRIWKKVNGKTTYYFYDHAGLGAEVEEDGSVARSYGYYQDKEFSTLPAYQKNNGSYFFYINDQLNTPVLLLGVSGEVLWKASYTVNGIANISIEKAVNNLRFPGQYYDSESGLHYNYKRYYDPKVVSYISTDPMGIMAGTNYYSYTYGDPLNIYDPTGEILPFIVHGLVCVAIDMASNGGCVPNAADAVSCFIPGGPFVKRARTLANTACNINSFPGETLVNTREGKKVISEISAGDEVLSYSEWEERFVYRKVEDVITSKKLQVMAKVKLSNEQVFHATSEHPVYTLNRNWVEAQYLQSSDELLNYSGEKVYVESVEITQQLLPVYNLSVEETNTYTISDLGIVVHNNKDCKRRNRNAKILAAMMNLTAEMFSGMDSDPNTNTPPAEMPRSTDRGNTENEINRNKRPKNKGGGPPKKKRKKGRKYKF